MNIISNFKSLELMIWLNSFNHYDSYKCYIFIKSMLLQKTILLFQFWEPDIWFLASSHSCLGFINNINRFPLHLARWVPVAVGFKLQCVMKSVKICTSTQGVKTKTSEESARDITNVIHHHWRVNNGTIYLCVIILSLLHGHRRHMYRYNVFVYVYDWFLFWINIGISISFKVFPVILGHRSIYISFFPDE